MPNPYSGRLLDSVNGNPLNNVTIKLRYTDSSGQSRLLTTTTDASGIWRISNVPDGIDLSTVVITYVRDGFTSVTIKNPSPTGTFNFPPPNINSRTGGVFRFDGGFDAGKYLVSSLDPYDVGVLDYNLSQSNGTSNPDFEASLPVRSLSDKRANNLEVYVNQYFTSNGSPAPTIQKEILVQQGSYDPSKSLSYYKQWQYVEVEAGFAATPCRPIAITGSFRNNIRLTKPPGVNTLTIDAFGLPDRFGLSPTSNLANTVYTPTYYIRANQVGSLISWGFTIFLRERLSPSPTNIPRANTYPLVLSGSNSNGNLRQSLIDDWFIQTDGTINRNKASAVAQQVIGYNYIFNNNRPVANETDYLQHIDYCFNSLQGIPVVGYAIIQGDLVFNLNGIPNNNPFILSFIQGNVNGESRFSYRLC